VSNAITWLTVPLTCRVTATVYATPEAGAAAVAAFVPAPLVGADADVGAGVGVEDGAGAEVVVGATALVEAELANGTGSPNVIEVNWTPLLLAAAEISCTMPLPSGVEGIASCRVASFAVSALMLLYSPLSLSTVACSEAFWLSACCICAAAALASASLGETPTK
jgi:hypothetical protein